MSDEQMELLRDEPIKAKTPRKAIPLSELPEVNESPDEDLVKSIELFGCQMPILVIDGKKGYRIADGRRRVASLRLLEARFDENEESVGTNPYRKVISALYEDDVTAEAILTIQANEQRSPNPAAEFEAIMRLVKDHNLSAKMVARQLRVPVATVEARMRLSSLEPKLLEAFLGGDIAWSAVKEAVKLPKVAQRRVVKTLAKKKKEGKRVTAAEVKEERRVEVAKAQEAIPDVAFETPGVLEPRWPLKMVSGKKKFVDIEDLVTCVERNGYEEHLAVLVDEAGKTWNPVVEVRLTETKE